MYAVYESDVFISYQRDSTEFVSELSIKLSERGYMVWWDKHISYGREWRTDIDHHLEGTQLIVVVTEPNSMKSAYVTYEWCYALLGLKKDFHWIQIEDCNLDEGMYGLLISKLQSPIRVPRNHPSEEDWQRVVESFDQRLTGIKEIRKQGKVLANLKEIDIFQVEAAEFLGSVNDPFHVTLARQLLHTGLKIHFTTNGKVQRAIIKALEKVGDSTTIPYLISYLKTDHEEDIMRDTRALIAMLADETFRV
jgi:TIR domain